MAPVTRTLTIYYSALPKSVTLLMYFDPPKAGTAGKDQRQIAWKVGVAKANVAGTLTATYTAQLAFGHNAPGHGNIVSSSTWSPVPLGGSVDLINSEDGPIFNKPNPGTGGEVISVYNETGTYQSISVGFMNGDRYSPTFTWMDVGKDSGIEAEFHPILKILATSDYKQSELLDAHIATRHPIFEKNLVADIHEENSDWDLKQGPQGDYTITQITS